jgi:crotonobetainyl-CoA:carnitine CoA-transferase CaiB-like acyl-CoA transferase
MNAASPLAGINVIELGGSVAAPFCGEILADLGARVIKVERAEGGDDARKWGPPFWHGTSALFQSLNRNKLSITVDLRNPEQLAALRRLIVEEADILFQNLRPGSLAAFGLDAAALRREAPRLICCNLGAFGGAGPLKHHPGYDPLMQAFGGIMSVTGEAGRPPVRVGVPLIDMGCGMWSVIGILAALHRRDATGQGCTIDGSLYETALAWMTIPASYYNGSGTLPPRAGTGAASVVPYRGYATRDGFIVIGAGNDKLFRLLARALGHPEWVEDPRFLSNAARVENQGVLYPLIEEIVAGETSAHWLELLEKAGVPAAPMQSVDEVLRHSQTAALGMVQKTPDGRMDLISLPLSFDGERPRIKSAPPTLGEHTEEVLGGATRGARR